MAKVSIQMPEEFLLKVSKLGVKTDEIVPKVLVAGGEVVLSKVKTNLVSVVGKGTKVPSRSTGDLVAALGISPAKQDRHGNFNVKIGFDEPRIDGTSNAMLANILEYGKSGQPAKPFLKPAKSAAKASCIATMQAELQKELEKL